MSRLRWARVALMAVGGLVNAVAPLRAQDVGDPDNARIHRGSLALSPSIRLTNVGRDSNVFNDSEDQDVRSDVTATVSPAVEAWLRTHRIRLSGRSQLDFFYFRELSPLRALDTDHSGRLEVLLNRVMPWVSANLATTRHRQNLEIDAIARRRDDSVQVGTDVRLTGKTYVGLYAGRADLEYQSNSLYRETDLARALNHTASLEGLALRYAASPLTTFAINVEQHRDRFEFSSERNSDSVLISPSVEFKPLALVSGHAAMGFRRVRFLEGDQPEFKSMVASVDVQYTFRGRTQFGVSGRRDLEYSYLDAQHDYVLAGFTPTVMQRLGDRWDVRGTVGRFRLSYRRRGSEDVASANGLPSETVLSASLGVGYRRGRTRLGLDISHYQRNSAVSLARGYDRLRVGSSLSYLF